MRFSEKYGQVRTLRSRAGDDAGRIREYVLQCIWYDQLFSDEGLCTSDGRSLRVLSPGWWNHSEGPDFKGAQFELRGEIVAGDVEIHFTHSDWKQHGHHLDSRYDGVRLVVTVESQPPATLPSTSLGRAIPTLLLANFLEDDIREIADSLPIEAYPYSVPSTAGRCATLVATCSKAQFGKLLELAGEWRMLSKARMVRERIERVGADQAIYESFLAACGFSRYKHHFRVVAQQLPYDRVRQLAGKDPLLVEAAFLQLAGLLPDALPENTTAVAHFARLRSLRRDELAGLKRLPLTWQCTGVRPTNYPERRLAGAARFLSRTALAGLAETLNQIWHVDLSPVARRRSFEALFPTPMGFWAEHCNWVGRKLHTPTAPLGPGRARSIIGNVFIPAALAVARRQKDRLGEEKVFELFAALPKEADNHILKIMVPRIFGEGEKPKLRFRAQQGLLQLYQDWCEPNPSCRNCSMLRQLAVG